MFLAVVAGYVVSALFAFCGIANAIFFLQEMDQSAGYPAFLSGLAVHLWPLAVGCALFLLVQIAIQIEKQNLLTMEATFQMAQAKNNPPPSSRSLPKKRPEPSLQPDHPAPLSAPVHAQVPGSAPAASPAVDPSLPREKKDPPSSRSLPDGSKKLNFFRVD